MSTIVLTERDRQRFEQYVYPDPNSGCFIWGGASYRNGYGAFRLPQQRRNIGAHRAAMVLAGVQLPPGALVLHRCDTRCCVNPDHLYVGDYYDNARDAVVRGRSRRGRLPYGVRSEDSGARYRVQICVRGRMHHSRESFPTPEECHREALRLMRTLRNV